MDAMKVLVAYDAASMFTATVLEYVRSFELMPSCDISYLHVTHGAGGSVNLSSFDVVIHTYGARLCFERYATKKYLKKLASFKGIKVISIQDEYDFTEKTRRQLDLLRPDLVATAVPTDQQNLVYPAARYPKTKFLNVLTGYVPTERDAFNRRPIDDRTISLGYRGRPLPIRYGELGRLKSEIGTYFVDECKRRKFPNFDIAITEEDRIYGSAWYQWLGNCRCSLGVESGSNIFDFDGSISEEVAKSNGDPEQIKPSTSRKSSIRSTILNGANFTKSVRKCCARHSHGTI